MADRIMVNSEFTKNVFLKTFGKANPDVVYPCINIEAFDGFLKATPKLGIPR
jgi:hypothetical protein